MIAAEQIVDCVQARHHPFRRGEVKRAGRRRVFDDRDDGVVERLVLDERGDHGARRRPQLVCGALVQVDFVGTEIAD